MIRAFWRLVASWNGTREWLRELPVNFAWSAGDMTYCGCGAFPAVEGHVQADHREVLPLWRAQYLEVE